METWDEIRALLDLALRGLAIGLIGLLGYAVTLLVPIARAWLTEKITASAFARWTKVADGAAAEIADSSNPAVSVKAKAAEMVRGLPDAVQCWVAIRRRRRGRSTGRCLPSRSVRSSRSANDAPLSPIRLSGLWAGGASRTTCTARTPARAVARARGLYARAGGRE
jgi:hypothetical protein